MKYIIKEKEDSMRYKTRRRIIISLIIIINLIIVNLILFFKTDIFRTKRMAFFRYLNQSIDILSIIDFSEFEEYKKMVMDKSYIREGEAKIEFAQNIADSKILDNIRININEKGVNKKLNTKLTVKFNDNNLSETIYIKENEKKGLYNKDFSDSFICVEDFEIEELMKILGLYNNYIQPKELKGINTKELLRMSKQEKKHLMKCKDIIYKNVPDTAYLKIRKNNINIDSKNFVTTKYKLQLDSKQNANLQIKLLEKITKDSILMNYFTSKFKLLQFNEQYTDVNKFNKLLKNRIIELKKDPKIAGDFILEISEYKQKPIEIYIKIKDKEIKINYLTNGKEKKVKINYNKKNIYIIKNKEDIIFKMDNNLKNKNIIEIKYNKQGSIKENNIVNNIEIYFEKGIKKIKWIYKDKINFVEKIGVLESLNNSKKVILNNYKKDELKPFIEDLKNKINKEYISKGANIGVNLDPIFID